MYFFNINLIKWKKIDIFYLWKYHSMKIIAFVCKRINKLHLFWFVLKNRILLEYDLLVDTQVHRIKNALISYGLKTHKSSETQFTACNSIETDSTVAKKSNVRGNWIRWICYLCLNLNLYLFNWFVNLKNKISFLFYIVSRFVLQAHWKLW